MQSILDLTNLPSRAAQRLLFERLFDHVCSLEPTICINEWMKVSIEFFRAEVATSAPLSANTPAYCRLFYGLADMQQRPQKLPLQISLRILTLYAEVGDAYPAKTPRFLPLPLALILLVTAESDACPSAVWRAGSQVDDVLCVTGEGAEALGLSGEVRLGVNLKPYEATFKTITGPSAFSGRITRCAEVLAYRFATSVSCTDLGDERAMNI